MIELRNVTKNYGPTMAIADLSLETGPGEVVLIHGPSGSGKTTLLRLVAGLEIPDAGEILIDGRLASTPAGTSPPASRGIGMVFQRNALWPHMTVSGNILFIMDGLDREEKNQRCTQMLAALSLSPLARRYPAELSGGEARRAALARAVAVRPRILLLDEPLTNLDDELKSRAWEWLLGEILITKPTVLYVTHENPDMVAMPHRSIRLDRGRLIR